MPLNPKATYDYRLELAQQSSKDGNAIHLAAQDIAFNLGGPGKFLVYALFEAQPRDLDFVEEDRKTKREDSWWSGRTVSKPLVIEVRGK